MSFISTGINLYVLYAIIKRWTMPFDQWPAFKTGVIDEKGNVLVKKDYRTFEQNDSFTILDNFVRNIKKLPGMDSKLGSYAAAAYLLLKEDYDVDGFKKFLTEEFNEEHIKLIKEMERTQ